MSEIETQLEECGVCHSLHPIEDLTSFDDELVCPECMSILSLSAWHMEWQKKRYGLFWNIRF